MCGNKLPENFDKGMVKVADMCGSAHPDELSNMADKNKTRGI